MNKYLLLLLIILVPSVAAVEQTLGTFKAGTNITLLQVCSTCTYNNISYVTSPNNTILLTNKVMVKGGYAYNYTLSSEYTSTIGNYVVCGFGDESGSIKTWCYDFVVNNTGRIEPSGIVFALFIVGFILIIGLFIMLFLYSFGHILKKDFDMMDLAFDWGIYFVLLSFYIIQEQLLGLPLMSSVLEVFVVVGAFTHILGSLIFFLMITIMNSLNQTKRDMGVADD